MKQKLKALASLCLALALTLCLTLPAWAAGDGRLTENSTGTVTIKGLPETSTENLKVTAYKIIKVNYYSNTESGYNAPEDPAFDWVSVKDAADDDSKSVADWVRGTTGYEDYIGTAVEGEEADNSVQDVFNDTATIDFAAFYDDLANAIRENDVTFDSGYTVESETTSGAEGGPSITLKQVPAVEPNPATVTCELNDFEMGSYLVLIEGGMKIYKPVVVNLTPEWKNGAWTLSQDVPENLTVKYSEPGITKKVIDGEFPPTDNPQQDISTAATEDYAQVDIGDTVTYVLTATVPTFPSDAINKGYQISDILPDGMTLNADSITVRGYTSDTDNDGDEINKKTNDDETGAYTLTVTDTTANPQETATRPADFDKDNNLDRVTFNLNFDYSKLRDNSNPQQPYTKLIVTYTATANEKIAVVENNGNITGNQNTAYLDYNNNPYENPVGNAEPTWKTASDTATVYTYGLKVDKKSDTKDATGKDVYLPGAEFTLTKKDGTPINFVYTGDAGTTEGTYRVATPTEITEPGKTTTTLTVGNENSVNNKGKLTLSGLDVDTYILKETKAPAGYNLLSQPKEFTITDAKDNDAEQTATEEEKNTPDGIIDDEEGVADDKKNSTGYISFDVINTQGFTLPTTGGMGTVLFTAGGVVLMGAGLVLLVVFLRRRRAK